MSNETAELKKAQRLAADLRAKYKAERVRLDALSAERDQLASALENISAALVKPRQLGGYLQQSVAPRRG